MQYSISTLYNHLAFKSVDITFTTYVMLWFKLSVRVIAHKLTKY